MVNRRDFLKLIALSLIFPKDILAAEKTLSIDEQRRRIRENNLQSSKDNIPVRWNLELISRNLTKGLDTEKRRIKLFEFVQSFPYEIMHYDAQPTRLLDYERGDCRHKRELLYSLFKNSGEQVRRVGVVFDWADLPIPKEMLSILKTTGTTGFHSALEFKTNDSWVYVDPTWDQGLQKLGFPVTTNWDGISPTKRVTNGKLTFYPHPYNFDEVLSKHDIKYVQAENQAFVTAVNKYFRDNRDIKADYDKPLDILIK